MSIHIDFAAQKNCYAFSWSHGEICVGCGCCEKPSLERDKARLHYWLEEQKQNDNFHDWMPGFIRLQKKNIKANKSYFRRMVHLYGKKVNEAELLQANKEG